jgi:hypothetical protein
VAVFVEITENEWGKAGETPALPHSFSFKERPRMNNTNNPGKIKSGFSHAFCAKNL